MGISMRQVVWCSATLSLGAFFYVLTMEPMDERRNPRAGAIDRVPSRQNLVINIRRSLSSGQFTAADRQADALLANYSDDLEANYLRAILDRELGRTEQEALRWARLARQTRSLVEWVNRYTPEQIAYYRAWSFWGMGRAEEGQAMFRDLADGIEASGAGLEGGVTQYNLACYRAMGGQIDQALEHWERAVELGYGSDSGWWMADPDLEPLHADDRFWSIGAALVERRGQGEQLDVPLDGAVEGSGLESEG